MLKKVITKLVCTVLVLMLVFPATAFAAEPEDTVSPDLQAETTLEPSPTILLEDVSPVQTEGTIPSAEPSQAVQTAENNAENAPQPSPTAEEVPQDAAPAISLQSVADTTPPKLTSITHSASPCKTPTFSVTAQGVTDDKYGVANVRFAVWSENGGQDDIRWYDGVNDGSGNWTANINAADHKNDAGIYLVDIYGMDFANNTGFLGGTSIVMDHRDYTPPKLTSITQSASPCKTPTFSVTAQGVTDDKYGVANVRFAVWSENGGQDDIKWYEGVNDGSGNWKVTVNAADHKNDAGRYQIHIYGMDYANNTGYMGSTAIVMDHRDHTPPKLAGITQSASPCKTPTFSVTAQGVTDDIYGVANVRFAVWSENGGQDDIKWYEGVNDGSGNWKVTVNAADHKNDVGRYQIHIYGMDFANNTGYMGSTAIVMDHRDHTPPKLTSITQTPSPCEQPVFYVTAKGVTDDIYGVANVRFAVWSENGGQDDLRWYEGVNDGAGNWKVSVNAADHNNDVGRYQIHIYGMDYANNTGYMGSTVIVMNHRDYEPPKLTSITQTSSPCQTATFNVTARGVTDNRFGVAEVRFAVWSENGGQDDIKWYNGVNDGAGNWKVTVNAADHNNDVGRYQIHIYGMDYANNTGFMGSTAVVMDHLDKTQPAVGSFSTTNYGTYGESRIIIMDMLDRTGVKNVRAAVWSDVNGQDDLVWYDAYGSGTQWGITVPISNHMDEGTYSVHVYATDTLGNTGFAGATSFTVPVATYSCDDIAETYNYTYFISFWVKNISCNYGVKKVSYNIYTDLGHDIWVDASYNSYITNGYIYYKDMNDYHGEAYNDVWIQDNRGVWHYLATWKFNM